MGTRVMECTWLFSSTYHNNSTNIFNELFTAYELLTIWNSHSDAEATIVDSGATIQVSALTWVM